MAVYSKRFGLGTASSGVVDTFYTVPTGMTAIVQAIDALPTTSASGTLYLVIADGVTVTVAALTWGPGQASAQWEGKLVVNSGGTMSWFAASVDWTYQISGSLLDGVSP